jgi:DNA repair exonuclease SbcCD ATPase subunit
MTANPPDNRYRRRFLVEFTADESDLADRLGAVHGSKRRAIVTGLGLLESGEVESLRAQVAALEQERDAAKAAASKASEVLKAAKEHVGEAKTAAGELKSERAAHKQTKADLAQVKRELADTQQALATAQFEQQRYASALPTMAYCPACEKYVPRTEWAEQAAADGFIHIYHTKHGYQPKQTFTKQLSVMFWRGGTT